MATSETPADEPQQTSGGVRLLELITFGLGAVLIGLSLWVVIARLRYPIDAEWMTGAVRDGVDRIRDGKPLYSAPSARFVPFVYTPIYFWLAGTLAHVMSTFIACKVVSFAATLTTGWGIHCISRSLGASKRWAAIGVLLFAATYPLTLFFYDIERVDALSASFVVVAVALLVSRPAMLWSAIAGVLLGLAFFAKQPGVLAFAAAVAGLGFAGERRRALLVAGVGSLVFLAMFAYLEATTHGWFRYYCVKLPQAHGMRPELFSTFFVLDMPKAFAMAAGSLAVVVPVAWSFLRRRRAPEGESWQHLVFAFVLAAGMAGAFSLRAHLGGWANVLVAWLPLGCAATAVAAARAEESARGTTASALVRVLMLGGVSLQLLGTIFDPNDNSPNADDLAERQRFIALVRKLEVDGDVLITTSGHVVKGSSVHAAALFDVIRAGDRAPDDLLEGLEKRRYAALFVGAPDEFLCEKKTCLELVAMIERHYFVAGRRHERSRNGMTGFDARPRWVLRPRKAALPATSMKMLLLRQHIEMGLAETARARSPLDVEIVPQDEIEALADIQVDATQAASGPDLH